MDSSRHSRRNAGFFFGAMKAMNERKVEERGSGATGWREILFILLVVIAVEALLQFLLFLSLQGPFLENGPDVEAIFAARKEMIR